MRRVSVLTSGGDAAGMNAAIRAVVRTSLDIGWEVFGIRRGFAGLIAGDFVALGARDVGGIIQLRGTMLGSGRCLEFKTEAARALALRNLRQKEIDALVVIGGGWLPAGIVSTFTNWFSNRRNRLDNRQRSLWIRNHDWRYSTQHRFGVD